MSGQEGYEAANIARGYGMLLAHLEADTHWRQLIDSRGNLTDVRQVDSFPARLASKPLLQFAGLSEEDVEAISDDVRNALQNEAWESYFGQRGAGESRLEAVFRLGSQAVAPARGAQESADYKDLRDVKEVIGKWLDSPLAEPGALDPLVEAARSSLFSYGIDNGDSALCELAYFGSSEEVMHYFDQRLRDRGIEFPPKES